MPVVLHEGSEWRRRLRLVVDVVFFTLVMLPVFGLLLVGLYFLKASLGIDIVPAMHLPALIGF
ncbi:MAG: hypothetical protein AB1899_12560 [Pseudomonadota bacterium]